MTEQPMSGFGDQTKNEEKSKFNEIFILLHCYLTKFPFHRIFISWNFYLIEFSCGYNFSLIELILRFCYIFDMKIALLRF